MVQPGGSKIFTNYLQRTAEHLCDPVKVRGARRSDRPQIEQRLHAGHGSRTRRRVGNKRRRGLVQVLAQSFVVAEQEGLAGSDGASERGAKLVALERRCRALVKIIGRVESVITQEFKYGAM